jgi:DUF4097 and DUF4098 domain-containing protein YvlB
MRFREVLLVVFLLAVGVVVYQAQTGRWDLHFGWWEDDFFGWGKSYAFEETQTIQAPLPAGLQVTNSHGWIEVRGADQETIQLTFQKKIWRRDEAEARDVADKLHYKLDRTADTLLLSTNRDEFTRRNFETGFVLTVPRRMAVTVNNSYGPVMIKAAKEADVTNRHGKISVSEVEGRCNLEGTYEDIEASNLKADCRVVGSHADITVLSAAGDLRAETSYADIRFEDIGGKAEIVGIHSPVDGRRVKGSVSVETSYETTVLADVGAARVRSRHGEVETSNVHGDLDVRTSYEPVKARNVDGNLRVEGNNVEITAADIKGREISVATSHENVDLSDFSANVKISLRHGNVTLVPADLKFPLEVQAEYSNIDLSWPAGETSPLEAQSRGGSIHWGLPGKPSLEKTNGTSLVKAFVENANRPGVTLSTTYGDIRIEEKRGKF